MFNFILQFTDGKYPEKIEINNGDILISWSASLGVYKWNRGKALLNQHIFKVVFDKKPIDKQYFVFATEYHLREMEQQTHGATMKHITKSAFEKIEIPYPKLEKQKKIANKLERTKSLLLKQHRKIELLDQLLKARFVEMFGDPVSNPYGWDKVNISTVVRGRASNGYFAKRQEYVEDGNVAILGVAHVVNRMYSQVEGLPRTNASDVDIQKHKVGYGDMLFCRSSLVAEGIGKASIVPENTPDNTLFECHVIRLPLNLNKCIPEYMQVLSTTDYFRKQIIAQSKTATMTTIGQDGILKATIILPPIEKQREFYSFVKKVDKSKAAIQKSIDETQLLYDSLMQKYFG